MSATQHPEHKWAWQVQRQIQPLGKQFGRWAFGQLTPSSLLHILLWEGNIIIYQSGFRLWQRSGHHLPIEPRLFYPWPWQSLGGNLGWRIHTWCSSRAATTNVNWLLYTIWTLQLHIKNENGYLMHLELSGASEACVWPVAIKQGMSTISQFTISYAIIRRRTLSQLLTT